MRLQIRAARESDSLWLCERLRTQFSKAYGTRRELFQDEEFTQNFMATLMKEHVVLVAEKGAELVGFIAGLLHPGLYEPSLVMLTSCFFWVEHRFRRSAAASKLFKAFNLIGDEQADTVSMGMPMHADVSTRSMKRHGFELKERFFLREVTL